MEKRGGGRKRGTKKTGGRKAGTPNKLTTTVKERVLNVFNNLQDHPTANLEAWAIEETSEFYKIASKLIPTEVQATITQPEPIDLSKLTKDEIKQLISLHAKIGTGEAGSD